MSRRVLIPLVIAVLAGSLAGCNNKGNGDSVTTNDVSSSPSGGASVSSSAGPRSSGEIVSPSGGPG